MRLVTQVSTSVRRCAVLNGTLEVPFCPDSGAEVNAVGRQVVEQLRSVDPHVTAAVITPQRPVQVAGGTIIYCHESVVLDLSIETAAGPVQLVSIECLVLDADVEELLLVAPTLATLGIDIDRMIEQLAERSSVLDEAVADDLTDTDGYFGG